MAGKSDDNNLDFYIHLGNFLILECLIFDSCHFQM